MMSSENTVLSFEMTKKSCILYQTFIKYQVYLDLEKRSKLPVSKKKDDIVIIQNYLISPN